MVVKPILNKRQKSNGLKTVSLYIHTRGTRANYSTGIECKELSKISRKDKDLIEGLTILKFKINVRVR